MPRFLLPSLAYDRAAILRAAWVEARRLVVVRAKPCWPFPAQPITLRAALAEALRDTWDIAKAERGYAVWSAEQDADAARHAALPAREREIEAARHALMLAEHADSFTTANNAAVRAAHARLADALQATA